MSDHSDPAKRLHNHFLDLEAAVADSRENEEYTDDDDGFIVSDEEEVEYFSDQDLIEESQRPRLSLESDNESDPNENYATTSINEPDRSFVCNDQNAGSSAPQEGPNARTFSREEISERHSDNADQSRTTSVSDLTKEALLDGLVNLPGKTKSDLGYIELGSLPIPGDWEIWEVPVEVHQIHSAAPFPHTLCIQQVGSEYNNVARILRRAVEPGIHFRGVPPRSAFASPGILGRIFVEAFQWSDVAKICRGMFGVRWWETKASTFLDAMIYLNHRRELFVPEPGSWIRLKYPRYVNDLAFVRHAWTRILHKSDSDYKLLYKTRPREERLLEVVVVPRVKYTPRPGVSHENHITTSPTSSSTAGKRPHRIPAQLFDPVRAAEISGPRSLCKKQASSDSTVEYVYKGSTYDGAGYLILQITVHEYYPIAIYPTLDQIRCFLSSPSIPTTLKLKELRLATARELKEGDIAKVIASGYAGSIAKIEELVQDHAYVRLLDRGIRVQVPRQFLRCHFKLGDFVRVTRGDYIGAHGPDSGGKLFQPSHITESLQVIEFIDNGFRMGKPPPPESTSSAYLADPDENKKEIDYSHLEKLSVVVIKGPLKGQQGIVKSISITGFANIELQASYMQGRNLQSVGIDRLAYELEPNEWYIFDDTKLFARAAKPVANISSLISNIKVPEVNSNKSNQLTPWDPDFVYSEETALSPDERVRSSSGSCTDQTAKISNLADVGDNTPPLTQSLESPASTIPSDFWLIRLQNRDKIGCLRLKINSQSQLENGTYDGKIGVFKGIQGDKLKVYVHDITTTLFIPYRYALHAPPTKAWQLVQCLEEGKWFGHGFRILDYHDDRCNLTTYRGGNKGRWICTVPTRLLALASD
ncbi:hypothetical protein NP233_g12911 [Leucocoprinus birnbaumii]|uniref:KOW domain-containing protein n=1 Tax=Leucocoprinus birnbaumii TaxID=56174 RepID=A0AAD5YJZ9_9AGAR|nr:hypothetical protein NP233_g12911 [Leucocoprinus birnbaumii]